MMNTSRIAMLVLALSFAAARGDPEASMPQTQPTSPRGTTGTKELILSLGNNVTMKLVEIPAGKFLMGSPTTEKDRDKDEAQHEVTISNPFYMGVTHVTVDQFGVFVKDSAYKTKAEGAAPLMGIEISDGRLDIKRVYNRSWRYPGFDQKGDHPVVYVSFNDARAFCDWLSKKSRKTVALPTEAQWEYACRAGTKTVYPWGDNPDDGKGWANTADQGLATRVPHPFPEMILFNWDDGFVFTSPVGSFKANAFGLYDMIGNTWQWCQDYHWAYDNRAVTDPVITGTSTSSFRVLRGGSWLNGTPKLCRSASRDGCAPHGHGGGSHGFRVVVVGEGAK